MRIIYAVIAGGLIIIFAGVKVLETPWHKHQAREAVEKHLAPSDVKFRNLKYFDRVCGEYVVSTDPTQFHKFYWNAQTGLNIRDENKKRDQDAKPLEEAYVEGMLESWDENYTACQRYGK